MQALFNHDLASSLSLDEWTMACRCFGKRHLLAHKFGIVDDKYATQTRDPEAVVGRKVSIRPAEVHDLIVILRKLGASLVGAINLTKS